jgi:hypothetical protein
MVDFNLILGDLKGFNLALPLEQNSYKFACGLFCISIFQLLFSPSDLSNLEVFSYTAGYTATLYYSLSKTLLQPLNTKQDTALLNKTILTKNKQTNKHA